MQVCVCVCSWKTWMDNPICSHTVNLILFISFSEVRTMNLLFYCFLASVSELVCACVCVISWFVVSWFTLFSLNHGEMCLHLLVVAAASQPMCWLQGLAHIHMFPVCLAQQDTGWLHALLIIPTTHTLQGHKPNSIFQHTLVNITISGVLENDIREGNKHCSLLHVIISCICRE